MKLSDAIRLGAMLKPQASNGREWPDKSCVIQAGLEGAGWAAVDSEGETLYSTLSEQWPFTNIFIPHPVGQTRIPVYAILYNLNDHHRWTRERIADWVATIEPQEVEVIEVVKETELVER